MEATKWLDEIERALPKERELYRSEARRLAPVFLLIEGALKDGVDRKAIYNCLKQAGLDLTEGSFNNALVRLRAKKRQNQKGNKP